MTDVLLIAYHYPPMASSGAERVSSFVRYLSECGYRPHVLTAATYGGEDGGLVSRAHELLGLYRYFFNRRARDLPPPERSLSRTREGVLAGWAAFLKRRVLIPDGQIGWLPHALYVALGLVREKDIRLIFSTAPPYSAHLLGLGLRVLTGLPWVADFRDTWTFDPLDEALVEGTLRFRIEAALERAVVLQADRIVGVTELACADFRTRFPEAAPRVRRISNGFTSGEETASDRGGQDGRLDLVHTGSFSYSHVRRTPGPLFEALKRGLAEAPDLADQIRLILVGPLSREEAQMAAPLADAGLVQLEGALSRAGARLWQGRADVLLLVDHARCGKASNVPAKCYEYLALRKPILALVGDGATRDLIEGLNAGLCVRPDDPEAIWNGLAELLAMRGTLAKWRVSPDRLRPFHQDVLTRSLAQCFDEALDKG